MKSLEILDDVSLDLENYLGYLERDLQERIKNNESGISISEVVDARAILVTNMYYGINKIKKDLEKYERTKIILKKKGSLSREDKKFLESLIEENRNDN